jgi:hypothetical protein
LSARLLNINSVPLWAPWDRCSPRATKGRKDTLQCSPFCPRLILPGLDGGGTIISCSTDLGECGSCCDCHVREATLPARRRTILLSTVPVFGPLICFFHDRLLETQHRTIQLLLLILLSSRTKIGIKQGMDTLDNHRSGTTRCDGISRIVVGSQLDKVLARWNT